jgi:ATP-dependent RNA helicase DDX46/PRP5
MGSAIKKQRLVLKAAALAKQKLDASASAKRERHTAEVEINDYPQKARYKVTHRSVLDPVCDFTGAAISVKGVHVLPGRKGQKGERRLYLEIEGPSVVAVKRARMEIVRILEEVTMEVGFDKNTLKGKYKVV